MTIGLLGGSFDPPHAGHVHITRWALARLGLNRVWWLVSPGNPLKRNGPAGIRRRMAAARAIMDHPRVTITDLEARIGTRYTAETLAILVRRYPGVRFVWLMGADNLAEFHRWDRWTAILRLVPVAVLPRPGRQIAAGLSPAARRFADARRPPHAAQSLARAQPPAWTLLDGPTVGLSSTRLRAEGRWRVEDRGPGRPADRRPAPIGPGRPAR